MSISTQQAGALMFAGYGVERWMFTKVLAKGKLDCKAQKYACTLTGGEKANGLVNQEKSTLKTEDV